MNSQQGASGAGAATLSPVGACSKTKQSRMPATQVRDFVWEPKILSRGLCSVVALSFRESENIWRGVAMQEKEAELSHTHVLSRETGQTERSV